MPTVPATRSRMPLIVDQESLTNAVAAEVLTKLGDLFARIQAAPITVPVPAITVSPAELTPNITVNPSSVTVASDTELAAVMHEVVTRLVSIETLLAAPVTRTIQRNREGEIISMTERRG